MADKIPWCKFWHSCLSDPSLEELELHQWARWARLIIFVRGHGDNGKMRLDYPARALQNVLRVPSYEALIDVIKLFKNVSLMVTDKQPLHEPSQVPSHSYFIIVKNWHKYQGDSSKERTRKYRVTKTVTKHVASDALEKSRVDLTSTSTSSALTDRGLTPRPFAKNQEKENAGYSPEELEQMEANKAWQQNTNEPQVDQDPKSFSQHLAQWRKDNPRGGHR
jgi:hypothetical protein